VAEGAKGPLAGGGLRIGEAVRVRGWHLASYRLKITRASRMSELVDRIITGLAALGGSAALLEILRRWLQRRQKKR
jgi:hypothetical protein